MNDITALAQRLKVYAEEFSYPVLSPDDCRALVEALEARDKQNAELEQLLSDGVTEEALKLRERIAELESLTVTVKLYYDFQLCHYGTSEDYAKGYIDCQNNFTKWLGAAGIQVIEGE